jgi:hypothetical protein
VALQTNTNQDADAAHLKEGRWMTEEDLQLMLQAIEKLLATQAGLEAAVSLMADTHPDRAALIAAYPQVRSAIDSHSMYRHQPECAREQAVETLARVLRMPRY